MGTLRGRDRGKEKRRSHIDSAGSAVVLEARVQPRARRNKVELLAEGLGVAKSAISILRGQRESEQAVSSPGPDVSGGFSPPHTGEVRRSFGQLTTSP